MPGFPAKLCQSVGRTVTYDDFVCSTASNHTPLYYSPLSTPLEDSIGLTIGITGFLKSSTLQIKFKESYMRGGAQASGIRPHIIDDRGPNGLPRPRGISHCRGIYTAGKQ